MDPNPHSYYQVIEASPYFDERQEQEARLVAAKQRERANATSVNAYHYRGPQEPSAQEPFHYPFHQGQVRRAVDDHMTTYDQRYGNCRSGITMPVTFLKHKNPRFHTGLPRSSTGYVGSREPSGYERAAAAGYVYN